MENNTLKMKTIRFVKYVWPFFVIVHKRVSDQCSHKEEINWLVCISWQHESWSKMLMVAYRSNDCNLFRINWANHLILYQQVLKNISQFICQILTLLNIIDVFINLSGCDDYFELLEGCYSSNFHSLKIW